MSGSLHRRQAPLYDWAIDIIDGDRSSKYPKESDFTADGVPFLNTTNIRDWHLDLSDLRFVSEAKSSEISKGKAQPSDILMTTRGTIGRVARFDCRFPTAIINAQMLILRADGATVDPNFLFYVLRSDQTQSAIKGFSSGSAQPQIPIRDLRQVSISLPEIDEQRRIASILGAYDDLIEVNRRRVAMLESMARGLFEEWFVRFRFPGHENYKIIDTPDGPLPEGWAYVGLHDVADVTFGFPFKSKLFSTEPEDTRVVRIRDVVDGTTNTWTTESFDGARYGVRDGDLLVGMDGYFHTSVWVGGAAALNQRVTRLRPLQHLSTGWLFMSALPKIKHLEATVTGTTVAHLSARHLGAMRLLKASSPVQLLVDQFLAPIDAQLLGLRLANLSLAYSRDLLLPRLISGELSVAVAQRELEAAA